MEKSGQKQKTLHNLIRGGGGALEEDIKAKLRHF
jgi:uncharacterized protein YjhX (UPF0386 family)